MGYSSAVVSNHIYSISDLNQILDSVLAPGMAACILGCMYVSCRFACISCKVQKCARYIYLI